VIAFRASNWLCDSAPGLRVSSDPSRPRHASDSGRFSWLVDGKPYHRTCAWRRTVGQHWQPLASTHKVRWSFSVDPPSLGGPLTPSYSTSHHGLAPLIHLDVLHCNYLLAARFELLKGQGAVKERRLHAIDRTG
jgi:hypothetical protein